MTELFLLGAGASVEAGIPGAYEMTKAMLGRFVVYRHQRTAKILRFVVGGLLFQEGMRGADPYGGVNIEELFNAVILLGDRQNSELGPFISSWHPQVARLEAGNLGAYTSRGILRRIYEPVEEWIEEILRPIRQGHASAGIPWGRNEINDFRAASQFEDAFVQGVREVMVGSEGTLFKTAADAMIAELTEMVWLKDASKVAYLEPLLKYAQATHSILVTLNYDNSVELASQSSNAEVDTGFDSWSNSGEFVFGDGKIPLLKLHGSIDWALSEGATSADKPLPYQVINRVDLNVDNEQRLRPAVVFGGRNKLTAKGPFLSLLRAFEQGLGEADTLWIIGYSFRDEHVNEFIVRWFNADAHRTIKVVNPDPNLPKAGLVQDIARRAGERMQHLQLGTAEALSTLAGVT